MEKIPGHNFVGWTWSKDFVMNVILQRCFKSYKYLWQKQKRPVKIVEIKRNVNNKSQRKLRVHSLCRCFSKWREYCEQIYNNKNNYNIIIEAATCVGNRMWFNNSNSPKTHIWIEIGIIYERNRIWNWLTDRPTDRPITLNIVLSEKPMVD
jgi:hypothetical protein